MKEKSWTLTNRQLCDCEMILDKSFYPLDRFMTKDDYESVLSRMRLRDDSLFPIPIVLDVDQQFAENLKIGEEIILRQKEGFKVASLRIESIWEPELELEALNVYNTIDLHHPGVNYLFKKINKVYLGGKINKINNIVHYDFRHYRLTPGDLKKIFKNEGWGKIIAFQTRNPLHRAHTEMILMSMRELNAKLLLHPVVGSTRPGDIDHYTRVRCYEHVLKKFPKIL